MNWITAITLSAAAALVTTGGVARAESTGKGSVAVKIVETLPTSGENGFYTSNRAPLVPSPLIKLPIGSITPQGWLRHQLELEANGMTGHLEEISPWCKFDGNAWVSPEGKGHSGWEELPYWLKGYGDLGYVLKDEKIIKEARRWIDGVLASQEADGYFGPRANKTGLDGKPDLWPNMLMLNALQSFYEATGDERVLPFMTKYCRWLNELPVEAFGWMENDAGHLPRTPMFRIGITKETDYRLAESGCKVHCSAITTDDGVAERERGDQVFKSFRRNGMERQSCRGSQHITGLLIIARMEWVIGAPGRPEQEKSGIEFLMQRAGQLGKSICRPALG